ncbi:MAG: adenylate kinase [Muribaculaceae bacterium]|nr:adenylate kinase [Muribaculaceae bacterium]
MFNLVIFGAPGSGKGTQSAKIIDKYGFMHISTGDVLRDQIARHTPDGQLAESYISQGHLIPDEVMVKILEDVLDANKDKAVKGIVFDGFPRTVHQAEVLAEMLEHRGSKINAVVGLEVDDDELVKRLLNRGLTSGRKDDNLETINERLKVYHDTTSPIKDFYVNNGLYRSVDGIGTVDQIFDRISNIIDGAN